MGSLSPRLRLELAYAMEGLSNHAGVNKLFYIKNVVIS